MNKRGISYFANWPEMMSLLFAILGLVIALFIESAFLNYVACSIFGFMIGKMLFKLRKSMKMPFVLIFCAFAIGYFFGMRYGSWHVALFFMVVGSIIGHYIYEQGHLT